METLFNHVAYLPDIILFGYCDRASISLVDAPGTFPYPILGQYMHLPLNILMNDDSLDPVSKFVGIVNINNSIRSLTGMPCIQTFPGIGRNRPQIPFNDFNIFKGHIRRLQA